MNAYEFIVKMKDYASSQLKQVANSVGVASIKVKDFIKDYEVTEEETAYALRANCENENIKRRRGFGKNQGTGNTDDGRSGRPGSEAGHCAGGGKTGRYVLRTGGCEEDGELRPAGPDLCVPGADKRQRFQG